MINTFQKNKRGLHPKERGDNTSIFLRSIPHLLKGENLIHEEDTKAEGLWVLAGTG